MKIRFQSDDFGKLLLRLTLGALLWFHGFAKLMNPAQTLEYIGNRLAAMDLPAYVAYGVFVGEAIAPILIIFGIYSRVGGLLVVINMIFALVLVHTSQLLTLSKSGGWALELQGFYLMTGLALVFLGSGKIAVKPD